MANPKMLFSFIQKCEGGFSDHKNDKGGKTNMGITLRTWKSCGYDKDADGDIDADDLKLINPDDVFNLYKKYYWDRCLADHINSQSLANMLVDWYWNSGTAAIRITQRLLQVPDDGIVGKMTISTLNQVNPKAFFEVLKNARIEFIENIIRRNSSQEVFRKGWMNRINDIKFVG